MTPTIFGFLIVACLTQCGHFQSLEFSDVYSVRGVLNLPYAEIKEPFVGYFDSVNQRSRIDYYGDLEVTYQRGDLVSHGVKGVRYTLAWSVNTENGDPSRVCFRINGTEDSPIGPQSLLPDTSILFMNGKESCPSGDGTCERWTHNETIGDKENKYTLHVRRGHNGEAIPVRYTMLGFNSLLGSHYDHYIVDYLNYRNGTIDENVFDVPSNVTCGSFPGPGIQNIAIHNAMEEFMSTHEKREQHNQQQFDRFKRQHLKSYKDKKDEEKRKANFRHNHRYVHSRNRALSKHSRYTLKVNHLADFALEELRMLRGRRYTPGYNGGMLFKSRSVASKVPEYLDYRLLGAVTPVKDQAVCGSCWSFGTVGTIEGVNFVKTGKLVKLAEQQLIDCSWPYENNGCDGGEDFRAYKYIMKAGGLASSEDYGSYLGIDGKCHDKSTLKSVKLGGFVNVTSGNVNALKVALFENGPISISIDASLKDFSFYSNGVFYNSDCKNKPDELDHSVLAVGYGKLLGRNYWLVKNSWSTYWGNDGYILIDQANNNCGVLTAPTFPIIE